MGSLRNRLRLERAAEFLCYGRRHVGDLPSRTGQTYLERRQPTTRLLEPAIDEFARGFALGDQFSLGSVDFEMRDGAKLVLFRNG